MVLSPLERYLQDLRPQLARALQMRGALVLELRPDGLTPEERSQFQ